MKSNIYALMLVAIMVLSTFGYAFFYVSPSHTGNEITGSVINYEPDEETKMKYMRYGVTFVTVYHNNADEFFAKFIRSIPKTYKTNLGETQVVVVELIKNTSVPYVRIESTNGVRELNTSDIQSIRRALCEMLVFKPAVCIELNATS